MPGAPGDVVEKDVEDESVTGRGEGNGVGYYLS